MLTTLDLLNPARETVRHVVTSKRPVLLQVRMKMQHGLRGLINKLTVP